MVNSWKNETSYKNNKEKNYNKNLWQKKGMKMW